VAFVGACGPEGRQRATIAAAQEVAAKSGPVAVGIAPSTGLSGCPSAADLTAGVTAAEAADLAFSAP